MGDEIASARARRSLESLYDSNDARDRLRKMLKRDSEQFGSFDCAARKRRRQQLSAESTPETPFECVIKRATWKAVSHALAEAYRATYAKGNIPLTVQVRILSDSGMQDQDQDQDKVQKQVQVQKQEQEQDDNNDDDKRKTAHLKYRRGRDSLHGLMEKVLKLKKSKKAKRTARIARWRRRVLMRCSFPAFK